MPDYLVDVIEQKVKLSEADKSLCRSYFEEIHIDKNSILERQGRIPQFLYFICTGFMRLFYYDEDGEEVTTHISSPMDFITSFISFINEKPATENVACVTDCELLRISKPDLASLIGLSETFKQFSLIIFEHAITRTTARANGLATLNAKQRYNDLLVNHPDILKYVPIRYIASYLGMKPESLSRVRKAASGKK